MPALILFINLVALYVIWRSLYPERDWRESALSAAVTWGVLITLSTEILGTFHAITWQLILTFWFLVLIVSVVVIVWKKPNLNFKFKFPQIEDKLEWTMLGIIALYVVVTLFVALISPPNTNDALQYHMSRVMHWIVNRSVAFYPTPVERQLWMPPYAEYAILHFQLLAGGDRFANMVQWLSMLGTVIGVSLIAAQLGVKQKGQIFASLFAATLPMGILQSTSAQTDYTAAFWGVCLTYYVISECKKYASNTQGGLSVNSVMLSLAFGLGALTKGTVYAVALPILVYLLLVLVWKKRWKTTLGLVMLGLAATLILNGGIWGRNFSVYGTPLGPAGGAYGSTNFSPLMVFSTALRNASAQMAFDNGPGNKVLYISNQKIHEFLGLDISDPRTTMGEYRIRYSIHEDFAGNKWHVMFWILATIQVIVIFFIQINRTPPGTIKKSFVARIASHDYTFYIPYFFTVIVLAGYLLFSALFKWQDTNSRLLMPWLVVISPMLGWAFDNIKRIIQVGVVALLALSSLTVLVSNPSRPLINYGQNQSILTVSRQKTLFNNSPEVMNDYISVLVTARELKCKSFGFELDSKDPEYLVWAILAPSGQELNKVEHFLIMPETKQFVTPGYRPCAVVCSICNKTREMGYQEMYDRGSLSLFIDPGQQ
jgi:4-amino-4-deoxy-L-arabinose transferase-like glycosyltransferase